MKNLFRHFLCIIFCCVLCLLQQPGNVSAAENEEGVQLPTDSSIVFYLENTAQKPYTKIANKVDVLWVGEHHRFTVAANGRESVSVSWSSSNPEVAAIDKKTGELTALSVGKTKITMKDSRNNAKASYTLTVQAAAVLPEMPEEWYIIEEEEEAAILYFKPEYRYLYEQCSMLKIPAEFNEKEVLVSTLGAEPWRFVLKDIGFTNLRLLSCSGDASFVGKQDTGKGLRSMLVPDGVKMFLRRSDTGLEEIEQLHLPDGLEVAANCYHSRNLAQVRIPASLRAVEYDFDFLVDPSPKFAPQLEFCVDGNNPVYYSLFGKLFCYDTNANYDYSSNHWKNVPSIMKSYVDQKGVSTYQVPYGVTKLANGAFYDVKYLKKVVLPETVMRLEVNAFKECTSLEEIHIPASVVWLQDGGDWTCFGHFEDAAYSDLTIVTPKGSAAEAYAIEYGIKYRNE